ncbi:restriction endonuclease [Sporosarcina sp. Te-1]|uniref:restriction endonuclease n=1 Tax=Sporosarcina sp. Te-1 TaxID=2818390 RepID=UPI001A9F279D|nr:restriction endonuclease [Sporosarcina sp. Te-1]QTD40830.1 restriction endonuclease [Sporosarcina sp. Te-1]
MRNRTKKEQKVIDEAIGLVILLAGVAGWYGTGNIKGAGIGAGIGFAVVIAITIWRSVRFSKRMKRSGIAEIDQMTGRQFEEYVGILFKNQGYGVTYTPTTGDFGADLILKKGNEVVVVQAKRYKQSVGIKAVQEVIPAIKMYNANAAWVITNSTYTKQVRELAKRNRVRMIDRDELIRMSIELKNSEDVPVKQAAR